MEPEFYPEALEDWSKGCAGCVAREELNIAFVALDEACVLYAPQLSYTVFMVSCLTFRVSEESGEEREENTFAFADSYAATEKCLHDFMDWHRRLAERHRLSDLAVVLLYYLAEQYGELGEHLRDGVAASDEYIQYALDGAKQREESFTLLSESHKRLCLVLSRIISKIDLSTQGALHLKELEERNLRTLQTGFAALKSAYDDVVAKTATVWKNLLPYKEERAKQAFKVSVSDK